MFFFIDGAGFSRFSNRAVYEWRHLRFILAENAGNRIWRSECDWIHWIRKG
jgi:hypothetical protein